VASACWRSSFEQPAHMIFRPKLQSPAWTPSVARLAGAERIPSRTRFRP
jgi:hypothetical protein